jgi:hypothetical protein
MVSDPGHDSGNEVTLGKLYRYFCSGESKQRENASALDLSRHGDCAIRLARYR